MAAKRMKRPSYREAIAWVAQNDDASVTDPELVHAAVTVGFVADLFGVEQKKVTADVIKFREKRDGNE